MKSHPAINAIVRTERAVVAVALVATLAAAVGLWRVGLREDYRLEAFVATNDPSYAQYRAFMDEFTSNEFALLAIHRDKPFDAGMEAVLAEAARRLATVPAVAKAGALTDIPALVRGAFGDRLYDHPLLAGNLISTDRKTVAVLCRMAGERGDGPERRKTVADMRAIVGELRAEHPDCTFLLTGPYVTLIDMYNYVEHDLVVFSVLAFALMTVTLGLVFRRWQPMVYCAGVAACAILCTLGLTIAAGIVTSLVTQMLVVLIIVLAVANCVQLAVAARESVVALPEADRVTRYRATLAHMAAPCAAAIVTTMAGFGSVGVSAIAPVRRFGGLMVFGLAVALIVGFAGVGWLHCGHAPKRTEHGRLSGWLESVSRWTLAHRRGCMLGFGVLVLAALPGFARLRFESDFVKNFRPASEVRRSYHFIEQNLSPLGSVEIVVRRRDGGFIASADAVRTAHALGAEVVARHALVKRALSLYDLLTLVFPVEPAGDADVRTRLAALRLWPSGEGLRRGFLN
ncbi:MAG TPA: MMPL family transporter, partial [Phycisphaerae bacterium]|nr:MMPL family transporter [Phycisphaerae bacterium]